MENSNKNPLGKWNDGWRVMLILLVVAFFIAGFGKDLEEVRSDNLLGLTGWHFVSVFMGFGIGVMTAEGRYKK